MARHAHTQPHYAPHGPSEPGSLGAEYVPTGPSPMGHSPAGYGQPCHASPPRPFPSRPFGRKPFGRRSRSGTEQPVPVRVMRESDSVSFVGMAALGATFVGFLSYGRDPDVLTTALASGATFVVTWGALYVLHLALKMTMLAAKMLLPFGLLLAIGCAADWQWAETTVDWISYFAGRGAEVANEQLSEWRKQ